MHVSKITQTTAFSANAATFAFPHNDSTLGNFAFSLASFSVFYTTGSYAAHLTTVNYTPSTMRFHTTTLSRANRMLPGDYNETQGKPLHEVAEN